MSEQIYPYALLVIDVQQGLFKRSTPIYEAKSLLANLRALIKHSYYQDALVVFVQHSNEAILRRDTPNWRLHPSLQPQPDDLHIYKQHGSAFKETELGRELDQRGIRKLVICGLVTQGCVKSGTLDALSLGYQVTLIADAHSSYSKDAAKLIKRWNKTLEQAGAVLQTTQQFIQQA